MWYFCLLWCHITYSYFHIGDHHSYSYILSNCNHSGRITDIVLFVKKNLPTHQVHTCWVHATLRRPQLTGFIAAIFTSYYGFPICLGCIDQGQMRLVFLWSDLWACAVVAIFCRCVAAFSPKFPHGECVSKLLSLSQGLSQFTQPAAQRLGRRGDDHWKRRCRCLSVCTPGSQACLHLACFSSQG